MMTYDQARSLEVGDELIHDTGIKRKVVKYNTGKRHIWLKPRLVGKGKAASMSQTQLIQHHSLPVTVLVSEKDKGDVFNRVFRKGDPVPMPDLALVGRQIAEFHKDGLIPQCSPRVEAYFMLLEAQFEDADHAS